MTQVVFQNAVTAAGNGNTLTVNGMKTLTVEIFGTATSAQVNFMAASVSGTYTPITGTNLDGFTQAVDVTSVSATPQLWQFDVTALASVQMQVASISGGSITVQGQVSV